MPCGYIGAARAAYPTNSRTSNLPNPRAKLAHESATILAFCTIAGAILQLAAAPLRLSAGPPYFAPPLPVPIGSSHRGLGPLGSDPGAAAGGRAQVGKVKAIYPISAHRSSLLAATVGHI